MEKERSRKMETSRKREKKRSRKMEIDLERWRKRSRERWRNGKSEERPRKMEKGK